MGRWWSLVGDMRQPAPAPKLRKSWKRQGTKNQLEKWKRQHSGWEKPKHSAPNQLRNPATALKPAEKPETFIKNQLRNQKDYTKTCRIKPKTPAPKPAEKLKETTPKQDNHTQSSVWLGRNYTKSDGKWMGRWWLLLILMESDKNAWFILSNSRRCHAATNG